MYAFIIAAPGHYGDAPRIRRIVPGGQAVDCGAGEVAYYAPGHHEDESAWQPGDAVPMPGQLGNPDVMPSCWDVVPAQ